MEDKMVPMSDLEEAMALIVQNAIRQWNKYYRSYTRLWQNDEKATVSNMTDEAGFLEFARIQLIVTLDIYSDLLGHEYTGKIPTSFTQARDDET